MSLNIKRAEAYQLAHELANLTGESVTEAVTIAVRERLDRIRGETETSLRNKILAIRRDVSSRIKEPHCSTDHADLLYDDLGLPK